MGREGFSHQFRSFLQRSFSLLDGGFAGFAGEFGYLVELLVQFGLDELELGFVAAEELGADFWVRHGCEPSGKEIKTILQLVEIVDARPAPVFRTLIKGRWTDN